MIYLWTTESGYLGVLVWDAGGGAVVSLPDETGRIRYNQIRLAHRTGDGHKLLTWTTAAPGSHSASGTAGQIAYDSSGNFYWCYAANSWARIGPAGYSNTF